MNMVESGQLLPSEYGYQNPNQPNLGIEVLTFRELRSRVPARTITAPHRLDFHQLILVVAGEGKAVIDLKELPCLPGTLMHVSPGQVQRLPTVNDYPAEIDALVVLFTAMFPPSIGKIVQLLDQSNDLVAWSLSAAEYRILKRALEELMVEYRRALQNPNPDALTGEVLRQLLAVVLLRIARLPHPVGASVRSPRSDVFHRFRHELNQSAIASRRASSYASRLGLSLRSLNRACQEATGHTAKDLIDRQTVLEAKRLLVHTRLPVAEISGQLGFTEPSNFGKFFFRETGHTPGAFRTSEI